MSPQQSLSLLLVQFVEWKQTFSCLSESTSLQQILSHVLALSFSPGATETTHQIGNHLSTQVDDYSNNYEEI